MRCFVITFVCHAKPQMLKLQKQQPGITMAKVQIKSEKQNLLVAYLHSVYVATRF